MKNLQTGSVKNHAQQIVLTAFAILSLLIGFIPERALAQVDNLSQVGFSVVAAPSGLDVITTSTVFQDIPEMSAGIITSANGKLKITFSGEAATTGGKRMFARALVDGVAADPSDVVFVIGSLKVSRSFTFVKTGLTAGGHWVQIQWYVDSGGTALMGDRTLTLFSPPPNMSEVGLEVRAAPSSLDKTTTSTSFIDIPDLVSSITTSTTTDLEITFSAEASATGGQAMFVRVLVDGLPAEPSDVLFAKGGFTGSRSFSFILKILAPGIHSVQPQWSVDPGGTGSLGDRTLALVAARETTQNGGVTTLAAPSGSAITTTSTSFVNVPGMAITVGTPSQSKLEITFNAEAFASGSNRIFVRALVDGVPANPSDIQLANGALAGISSFTFTQENLAAGGHTVQIQWEVDPSGTASLGDRTLALNYWRAQVPDLTSIYNGGNPDSGNLWPTIGTRNLLVILWDPHRPAPDVAPDKTTIDTLVFGPRPSVRDYYAENSGGRLNLQRANVLGWYDADKPASYYWGPTDPTDADGDGFINPHTRKWFEAIRDANADFDFKTYDINNDGYLARSELGILIVIPQASQDGFNRKVLAKEFPSAVPLTVDGVKIELIAEAYIQSNLISHRGLVAHELAHLLLGGVNDKAGAADMYYNSFFFPYEAGPYSLMDDSPPFSTHLDPFHKLRGGWIAPRVVTADGWYNIRNVENNNEAYILYDPARGNKEYFIIENRRRDGNYDGSTLGGGLPDTGIAVWHIIEDPAVFNSLPAPAGVSSSNWATTMNEWGRRGIRLIRPVYGPPVSQINALWDISAYDLLSTDADASHATLKWADGTASGFSIQAFPASNLEMEVHIGTNGRTLPSIVVSPIGADKVYFDVSTGSIIDLVEVKVSDIPETPPPSTSFPYNLSGLRVKDVPTGGSVTFTLVFPANLPSGTTMWIFGPTPTNPLPDWFTVSSTTNGRKLTFTLTDGGIGDIDLIANGIINVVGGPSITSAVPVPDLTVWGIAGLIAIFGLALVWVIRLDKVLQKPGNR